MFWTLKNEANTVALHFYGDTNEARKRMYAEKRKTGKEYFLYGRYCKGNSIARIASTKFDEVIYGEDITAINNPGNGEGTRADSN